MARSEQVCFFLEKFGSGPRRSLRRSAERPARAAWAALRLLAAVGATMELGRSWRTLLLMMLQLRPHGAGDLRGHRQTGGIERPAVDLVRASQWIKRRNAPLGPPPGRCRRFHFSSPSGLAGPAAHETLLLCGCVVGTEVGILLVRLSPSFSWTRGSLSTSDCGHGLSSAPEHAS